MYLAYLMWLLLASRNIQSPPNHTHITSVETTAMMASEFHVEEKYFMKSSSWSFRKILLHALQ